MTGFGADSASALLPIIILELFYGFATPSPGYTVFRFMAIPTYVTFCSLTGSLVTDAYMIPQLTSSLY